MTRFWPVPALASAALILSAGCAARPVTCQGVGSCGEKAVCVAGLCQADGGVSDLVKSRRIVLDAVDVAFIERGSAAPPGSLPSSVTLGREGQGPAAVLLRFDLPRDVEVLRAFLIVERDEDARSDGAGVGLHAERIIGAWDPGSVAWRDGPELRDVSAPSFVLRRGGPSRLRLDLDRLLRHPRTDEPPDHGIAIVADRSTADGASIVVLPKLPSPLPGDPPSGPVLGPSGPRLELYVK